MKVRVAAHPDNVGTECVGHCVGEVVEDGADLLSLCSYCPEGVDDCVSHALINGCVRRGAREKPAPVVVLEVSWCESPAEVLSVENMACGGHKRVVVRYVGESPCVERSLEVGDLVYHLLCKFFRM